MKKASVLMVIILAVFFSVGYSGNDQDKYQPIFMERTVLESSIDFLEPQALSDVGKIYVYRDYIFINERYEGIHIYDNSNPTQPVPFGFLKIPGNIDVAAKNGILYADNATDLISIDLSQIPEIHILERKRNMFLEAFGPDGETTELRPSENHVLIGWKKNY